MIPGTPVAKQRARRGRGGHWYTPARTREYEELVAWHCRARGERGDWWEEGDTVAASIVLHFRGAPRADIDNYAKSILDGAVKGGLLVDDQQVVLLNVQFVINPNDEEHAVLTVQRTGPRKKPPSEEGGSSCPYCAPDELCALHLP